jgi:hypothetical protein
MVQSDFGAPAILCTKLASSFAAVGRMNDLRVKHVRVIFAAFIGNRRIGRIRSETPITRKPSGSAGSPGRRDSSRPDISCPLAQTPSNSALSFCMSRNRHGQIHGVAASRPCRPTGRTWSARHNICPAPERLSGIRLRARADCPHPNRSRPAGQNHALGFQPFEALLGRLERRQSRNRRRPRARGARSAASPGCRNR